MNQMPLSELYRPKDFNEVLGVKDIDRLAELIKAPKEMPNLLFHGLPGTGKTSTAKIIIEKLKPIDFIRINGSDTTGVDTIRERVYNFMTGMSSIPDKPKIVWIEEFDYMSQNAFAALRSMMEQYMKNSRFICTCNYLHKIPEPMQSRFTCFEFKRPRADYIFTRLKQICDMEGITARDNVLLSIAEQSRGDFRTAINNLQQLSSNEIKTISSIDIEKNDSILEETYNLLKDGKWTDIRYKIPGQNPDYNKLLVDLDKKFFGSDLSISKKADINEIISYGMAEMSMSFDPNIAFCALCSRLIKRLHGGD